MGVFPLNKGGKKAKQDWVVKRFRVVVNQCGKAWSGRLLRTFRATEDRLELHFTRSLSIERNFQGVGNGPIAV